MTILELTKYPILEKQFRKNCLQVYPSTEIAYITRFLEGDETISQNLFSIENLQIIKNLTFKTL